MLPYMHIDGSQFPNAINMLPPASLAHPLSLFGHSMKVHRSTPLTICPDTLLQALLGSSMASLLRRWGLGNQFRQVQYGIERKHRLSETTQKNLRRTLGPVFNLYDAILDGTSDGSELRNSSLWDLVAIGLNVEAISDKNTIVDFVASEMLKLDRIGKTAFDLVRDGDEASARRVLSSVLSDAEDAWRTLTPGFDNFSMPCLALIETTMQVFARADAMFLKGCVPSTASSQFSALVAEGAKPIGNWLAEVKDDLGCATNRALSDLLAREGITLRDALISHDTLKGWSAMKPGMLMSFDGCMAVLIAVRCSERAKVMRNRFVAARLMGFLCDLVRSSTHGGELPWADAQYLVEQRYAQLFAREQQMLARPSC